MHQVQIHLPIFTCMYDINKYSLIFYLILIYLFFTLSNRYDLGFPPDLQQSIAKKFNDSVHAEYLVSYRPPYRVSLIS